MNKSMLKEQKKRSHMETKGIFLIFARLYADFNVMP